MSHEDQVGHPDQEPAELSDPIGSADGQNRQLNKLEDPGPSLEELKEPGLGQYPWGRAYFKFGEHSELDLSGEFPALALLVVAFGPIITAVFGCMAGLPLVAVLVTAGIVTVAVLVLVLVILLVKR